MTRKHNLLLDNVLAIVSNYRCVELGLLILLGDAQSLKHVASFRKFASILVSVVDK